MIVDRAASTGAPLLDGVVSHQLWRAVPMVPPHQSATLAGTGWKGWLPPAGVSVWTSRPASWRVPTAPNFLLDKWWGVPPRSRN